MYLSILRSTPTRAPYMFKPKAAFIKTLLNIRDDFFGIRGVFRISVIWVVFAWAGPSSAQNSGPRLEVLQDKSTLQGSVTTYKWSTDRDFVAIPDALRRRGDAACLAQGADLEAVGYHPHARFNDAPIRGGGFLCRLKSSGAEPQSPPPRMIIENGIAGWDNPRSFGRLPSSLALEGGRACSQKDPSLTAVAFHPNALDLQGRPIPGGAVFCAPLLSSPVAAR